MAARSTPTICRICGEHCGLLVTESAQRVTISGNPEHPFSRGFICFKGKNYSEVHHSPDRLTKPLLRKGTGFVEISYDEALEIMVSRLNSVRDRFGPESVIFYKGEALKHFEISQYMRHLSRGFGTPNYVSVGCLCHYALILGHSLTYGGIPRPRFDRNKSFLLWGVNPAASFPLTHSKIKKAVGNGAKLVTVDPFPTSTTNLADVHLPIRPGSDGFLALALIKYAVEKVGLAPVASEAHGWNELVDIVSGHSFDELVGKVDIPRALFDEAAVLLFDNLPTWTMAGLGLEHQQEGVQSIRAVALLQSLLDPQNRPHLKQAPLKRLPGRDMYPRRARPIGEDEAPLFTNLRKEAQGMLWTRAILEQRPYPVKSMVVAGANPMVTFPAPDQQRAALEALEFLTVFDMFMTPTARLAHLVFPAADQLDNLEIHDYGRMDTPSLGLMRPSTSSAKGWPTWKLIFELAARLGLESLFPWRDNREALSYRLSETDVTLTDLEQSPSATAPYTPAPIHPERWDTADGKVHYRSERLHEVGQPPIPTPETFDGASMTDKDFPFYVSTGNRIMEFQHGQFREIPKFRERYPKPLVYIHPNAAARLGIQSGERVRLRSRFGALDIETAITDEVREDCLRMTHGWEETNANHLAGLEHFDPISGFPWLRAIPVRVEKLQ